MDSYSSEITLDVTDSQYEAIKFPLDSDKVLKIIAGPGAGKTRTLVTKIAYSLSAGVKPEEILVLSLTNRAVLALKSQLSKLVGSELATAVNIQTFHSYAISVVSAHYSNDWKLLEDVGWKALIDITHNPSATDKAERRPRKFTRSEMERVIDLANSGVSSDEISGGFKNRASSSEVDNMMKWIHHSKIVTYRDLLKKATKEVTKNQAIVEEIKTIIVDEFQDMYGDLLDFLKAIVLNKNLVMAGDPNQSIFGFLGSDPQIMDKFDKELENKQTTTLILKECFRSTPEIIKVSDIIVNAEVPRTHVRESGPTPILKYFNSEIEEFAFISHELKKILNSSEGLVKPNDIAVLGRTNKKIDALKDYLEIEGIQTVKLSSVQLWIDSYVFHFVDYLQILSNPNGSDHSMMSVLALLDNVGNVTLRTLMRELSNRNMVLSSMDQITLWDYLRMIVNESAKHAKLFKPFINAIEAKREVFDNCKEKPDEVMKLLLSLGADLGLRKKISKTFQNPADSLKYQEHLKSFYESLCISNDLKPEGAPLVEYFLRHYNDVPILQDDKLVNLSTVHSAKGLEFPICFILAKDPPFPGQTENIQDERRNAYVAVTRASALLYYNKFVDPFASTSNLIKRSELPKIFSLKEPTLNRDFWSRYANCLGLKVGIRHYHTSSANRILKALVRNRRLYCRFIIH